MSEGPFNLFAHRMLTSDGAFIHTHVEADFDDGDPENGPGTHGHDAYDLYEGESHDLIVDRSGLIVHSDLIDWDQVRFFEGMEEPPQPIDDGSCDPLFGRRMDSADIGEC